MRKIITITIRLILFLVLLIVIIFVVLFSQGFRFDTEKKILIATGILDVSSKPDEAIFFLNDQFSGYTNQFVRDVPIENIIVRLEKGGYLPWQKIIKIDDQIITKINPILIPKNIEKYIEKLSTKNNTFIDPQKRGIAILYSNLNTIYFLDFISGQEKIFEYNEKIEEIFFSDDGRVLFPFSKGQKLFDVFSSLNSNSIFSLSQAEKHFTPSDEFVLFSKNNTIWKLEIDKNQTILIKNFSENIENFFYFPENQSIVIITKTQIKIMDYDGKNEYNLFKKNPYSSVFFIPNKQQIIWFFQDTWYKFSFF